MQDPNADTQWNDVLRSKGILPPKQDLEITEEQLRDMLENTIASKSGYKNVEDLTLDELDEVEDEEEERLLLEIRKKRIADMKALASASRFGDIREITSVDYVDEVNNAGEGIWVVLHLYQQGIPLCAIVNKHLTSIAARFPATKFLKSLSTNCIPNYPDRNLPTLFCYFEGQMKGKLIGPLEFGKNDVKEEYLERKLHNIGAVESSLEIYDKPVIDDYMDRSLRQC